MLDVEDATLVRLPCYPLKTLERIPISAPFLARVTRVLTEHGAVLMETQDCPNGNPPYKEFTIVFPLGTVWAFGLKMHRSRYFTITFLDGYHLNGGEFWPASLGDDDEPLMVLSLPREESRC